MRIWSVPFILVFALSISTCTKDPYVGPYESFYVQFGGQGDLIGRDVLMRQNSFVVCGYGQGISSDQDFCLFFIDSMQQYKSKQFVGTTGNDQCWSFTETSDGGYVIAGWTDLNNPGVSNDILIVKTDANGNQLWSKIYGGNYNDISTHIESAGDGFIVSGIKGGSSDENSWILRLDGNGDTLWTFTYGGNQNDGAMSVCGNGDGTFGITGYTNSSGNGSTDGYLMTLSSTGQLIGYYPFGTPDYEEPHCIEKISDGWVVSGHAGTLDIHTHNVFLQFIRSDGTMGKFLTYGGHEHDGAEDMQILHDHILIAGRSSTSNPLQGPILVETDLQGNEVSKQWLGQPVENPAFGLFANDQQVLITGYAVNSATGFKEIFLLRK